MVAAEGRDHQDGVRLAGVQRAVGDIGYREILDDLAALQREIADPIELVRRLVRGVRQRNAAGRQQAHQTDEQSMEHDRLLSFLPRPLMDQFLRNSSTSPKNSMRFFSNSTKCVASAI